LRFDNIAGDAYGGRVAGRAEVKLARPAEYGLALTVEHASLGDLLGPTLARAAFAPPLQALRQAWGAAAFDAVKQEHDRRRRAAST